MIVLGREPKYCDSDNSQRRGHSHYGGNGREIPSIFHKVQSAPHALHLTHIKQTANSLGGTFPFASPESA